MAYGTINADVIQSSVTGVSLGAGNATVFKNRIINGDMRINQRAFSGTATDGTYTLDRWQTSSTQASKFTVSQNAGSVTPPAGFINYLGATSSSAYSVTSTDRFTIVQPIEGLNIADLGWGTANAKTVTLSAWVYSSLTGTFGGSLLNNALDRSYPFTYSIPTANTWTQISVTIAGDTTGTWLTTNGSGINVNFSIGAGTTRSGTAGAWAGAFYTSATGAVSVVGTSGATFYITGVQLEVGSSATGFEYVDYGRELNLCQRYYQALVEGSGYFHSGSAISTSQVRGPRFTFFQTMRTTPTITLPTAGTGAGQMYYCQSSGAAASVGNFTPQQIKQDSFFLEGETWTGVLLGGASLLAAGSGGITIAISAEL
jgi:hypothetical protein